MAVVGVVVQVERNASNSEALSAVHGAQVRAEDADRSVCEQLPFMGDHLHMDARAFDFCRVFQGAKHVRKIFVQFSCTFARVQGMTGSWSTD